MRSVRLDSELEDLLARRVAQTGEPASEVIRAALRDHLSGAPKSPAQRAGALLGSLSRKEARRPRRGDQLAIALERKLKARSRR